MTLPDMDHFDRVNLWMSTVNKTVKVKIMPSHFMGERGPPGPRVSLPGGIHRGGGSEMLPKFDMGIPQGHPCLATDRKRLFIERCWHSIACLCQGVPSARSFMVTFPLATVAACLSLAYTYFPYLLLPDLPPLGVLQYSIVTTLHMHTRRNAPQMRPCASISVYCSMYYLYMYT